MHMQRVDVAMHDQTSEPAHHAAGHGCTCSANRGDDARRWLISSLCSNAQKRLESVEAESAGSCTNLGVETRAAAFSIW